MLADSGWEQHAANLFEMDARVLAYAKNDHPLNGSRTRPEIS
jgi:hypothetical protein